MYHMWLTLLSGAAFAFCAWQHANVREGSQSKQLPGPSVIAAQGKTPHTSTHALLHPQGIKTALWHQNCLEGMHDFCRAQHKSQLALVLASPEGFLASPSV